MQATLTSKSQITLPKGLQQWLGVQKGDKLEFVLEEGGARVQKASAPSFAALVGLLPPPSQTHTLEAMNDAIAQALVDKHALPARTGLKAKGKRTAKTNERTA
jgi:antitoxin PrlF